MPPEPVETVNKVPNSTSRARGYCWRWQRGSCTSGDRCRYKHGKGPSRGAMSNVAVPASLKSNDNHASVSHNDHSPRNTKAGVTPICLPVKEGCPFCMLGLCSNKHSTPASLVVSDSKVPQTTGPDKKSTLTLSEPLMSNTSQKNEGAGSNHSKCRPGTKPLTTKAFSGPEELTLTLLKSTRVTVGQGLQILNLSTAFETNIVALGNLPVIISDSDLRNMGTPFGEILSVEHRQAHSAGLGSFAKLVFANHSEAAAAIAALNGSMQFFAKITAQPYHQTQAREIGRLRACIVRVDIPAPGIAAYAGYETQQQAEQVIATMHGSTVKKHVVAAHLHNGLPKVGPFTVKFEGLPHQTTEKNVRTFGVVKGKPIAGDIMLQKASYKSLADARYVLGNIFEEYGVISFDFSRSIPFNGRIRGIARFASADGAAAAQRALNGRRFAFLGSEKIYLHHLHKMTYKIPLDIHRALCSELKRLASFAQGQPGVQLTFNDTASGEVEIDISASHLDSLKRVKAPLERMIAGETLAQEGRPVWDNFFSTASGHAFLDTISRQTETHIRPHHIRCFVKLWGTDAAIERAGKLIVNELTRLRARKFYAVPLTGKLLMRLLFNNLDAIHEEVGKDDVFVDFATRRLIVRGTEEQFLWIVNSLSKQSGSISVRGHSNNRPSVVDSQKTCPVCLDNVSHGVVLDCGHSVCKECLVRYLVSACDRKSFPLKCLGNDNQCTELLPLPLCQGLLQKEQFARLVDASFFTYIQTRPQEFHYCPTPDCPQIYRDAPGTTLQCPTCLVRICPSCHAVQHDGVECRVTNEAGERLFNEWREQHNVKTCPRCSANIQKIAGCNHLTCASCGTHICWECLETFRASNEVYDHMVKAHGGIGL